MQHHSDTERSATMAALNRLIAASSDPSPATVAAGILCSVEALTDAITDIVQREDVDIPTKFMAMNAALHEFNTQCNEHLPDWVALLAFEKSMARLRKQFPSEAADEAEAGRQSALSDIILNMLEQQAS